MSGKRGLSTKRALDPVPQAEYECPKRRIPRHLLRLPNHRGGLRKGTSLVETAGEPGEGLGAT